MTTLMISKLMTTLSTAQFAAIRNMVNRLPKALSMDRTINSLVKKGIMERTVHTSADGYYKHTGHCLTSLGYQVAYESGFMGEWSAYAEELHNLLANYRLYTSESTAEWIAPEEAMRGRKASYADEVAEAAYFEDMEEHSDPRSWLTWTEIQMGRKATTPEEVWEEAYNANALVCAWERGKAEREAAQAEVNASLRLRAYADGVADYAAGNPYNGVAYYSWEPHYANGWHAERVEHERAYIQGAADWNNNVLEVDGIKRFAHSPVLAAVYAKGHSQAAEYEAEQAAERASERYWEDRGEPLTPREEEYFAYMARVEVEFDHHDPEANFVRDPFFARLYAEAEELERESDKAWLEGAPARKAAQARARAEADAQIPF